MGSEFSQRLSCDALGFNQLIAFLPEHPISCWFPCLAKWKNECTDCFIILSLKLVCPFTKVSRIVKFNPINLRFYQHWRLNDWRLTTSVSNMTSWRSLTLLSGAIAGGFSCKKLWNYLRCAPSWSGTQPRVVKHQRTVGGNLCWEPSQKSHCQFCTSRGPHWITPGNFRVDSLVTSVSAAVIG